MMNTRVIFQSISNTDINLLLQNACHLGAEMNSYFPDEGLMQKI